MIVQRIIGRFGLQLLWCMFGALLVMSPGSVLAQAGTTTDACSQAGTQQNEAGCQNQPQAAVGYAGSQTQGWAYYCNDPTYQWFYGGVNGIAWNNTCFTEVENPATEGSAKADSSYTNWCLDSQSLTVVLACWNLPQPDD